MAKPRPAEFKWRQFEPQLILMAVGWYLRYSLSYRDVEELLLERGWKISPVAWQHIRFLGHYLFRDNRHPIDLEAILDHVGFD